MSGESFFRPVKGLNGDYRGTCVVCGKPTDTAIGVDGQAEALIVMLNKLGLGVDEAYGTALAMWSERFGTTNGNVPAGVHQFAAQVCTPCYEGSDWGRAVGSEGRPRILPEVRLVMMPLRGDDDE